MYHGFHKNKRVFNIDNNKKSAYLTDLVVNNSLTFDAQHINIRFKSIHQINIKFWSHILAAQIRDFVSHDASLRLC